MKEKNISKRQQDVLNYVKKYISSHGYPPAIREICKGLNLSSPATVFVHLKNLENLGYIRTTSNKFRTIEIVGTNEYLDTNEDIVKVPLLGKVTAGSPITAIEQPNEFFELPASLIPAAATVFTLHVSGDSMINKGIYDNDYVIVQKQNNAKNGDIVIAMTTDNEVTIKTFYKEKNYIRLQPENDTMKPIILDNCVILGKAIGLYRKLK